jgi:putative DNA primase/helicase
MLFSVNEVINFKETGLHITDRFVVIPFNATFTDNNNNRDIDMGSKLCKPLPLQIIATKSINAFIKVLKDGKFTIPPIVEEETNKYFMECNNAVEFCNLFPIKKFIGKTRYYEAILNSVNRP